MILNGGEDAPVVTRQSLADRRIVYAAPRFDMQYVTPQVRGNVTVKAVPSSGSDLKLTQPFR